MRKFILSVLSFTFLVLFSSQCFAGYLNVPEADRYLQLNSDDYADNFLDKKTFKVSKDTVTGKSELYDVWIKFVYTEEGRAEQINLRKKHNEDITGWDLLSHSQYHYLFKYSTNQIRIVEYTDYAAGKPLHSYTYSEYDSPWQSIVPDSNAEEWFSEIRKHHLGLLLDEIKKPRQ